MNRDRKIKNKYLEVCPCRGGMARRDFLRFAGVGSLALLASRLPVMAGPFANGELEELPPEDKKLAPEWVQSLFARGVPQVYTGAELKYIGMPVGGLCAGQLYLGGDGKLWHWDIFNEQRQTGSEHYAKPLEQEFPLLQEFVLRLGGKKIPLDRRGFAEIDFRGEYPVGIVNYRQVGLPVAVRLEAFSPYIPLNTEDSSLPATVLRYTVTNISAAPVETLLIGCLENAVCLNNRNVVGKRRNRITYEKGFNLLNCSVETEVPCTTADYGTMGLALLGEPAEFVATTGWGGTDDGTSVSHDAVSGLNEKLVGAIGRKIRLGAGKSVTVTFVLVWCFPFFRIDGVKEGGQFYGTKFNDTVAVARYVVGNFDRLSAATFLWRDTWYDSSLPFWLLDRTHMNASILATSTCHRFASGRFWAWEGVGCCPGTCGHVWHYAQTMGRLFPELERILREGTDFGVALNEDGSIGFRGENNDKVAIDAQAGSILRALREHQVSVDSTFLGRIWPGVKLATDWLIRKDGNDDGIIESYQHHTLDADWFGPVAWLSGLYQAALAAAAVMAEEMGDGGYAGKCRAILARGQKKLVADLFDGDYFINKPDPNHPTASNSGTGCQIDQVMGQSWAFQVGLPRVLPEKETRAALQALWKYNFSPDVGPYREKHKPGRWYAMAGEAGLLVCSFPRADWDFVKAAGEGSAMFAGYFNECMNGFEYQVAGHMLWENMLLEGLAVTRAVHDRYHALKRNPWNEVECGDHYARSMASYGVFLAACGFEYHGPRGHIGFAPRLAPEKFKACFTAAEGWGSFTQRLESGGLSARIEVKNGQLKLKSISLALGRVSNPRTVKIAVQEKIVDGTMAIREGKAIITLAADLVLQAGEAVELLLG